MLLLKIRVRLWLLRVETLEGQGELCLLRERPWKSQVEALVAQGEALVAQGDALGEAVLAQG